MRLLVLAMIAGSLAASAALTPALAITKTVRVPVAECSITVETKDVFIAVHDRRIRTERTGTTGVSTDC